MTQKLNTCEIQDNLSTIEELNRAILREFEIAEQSDTEDYKKFKDYANFIKNFMVF